MTHPSETKALMATTVIADLTRLVEQHGDLPVLIGLGHALTTPNRPKVIAAVKEERMKTMFACHRQLLGDSKTIPVIHFG